MQNLVARILMPLLLLAQVGAGMSPGRVLCIAADCCGEHRVVHHEHDAYHDHDGHHHAHHHAHGAHPHGDHRHPAGRDHDASLVAQVDCDCHIHIVMPDDAGSSRERSAERIGDVRLMQPALAIHSTMPSAAGRAAPPDAPPRWCFDASDQCLALKATRLLI
ncbi:MAG: hypothetical protein RIS45_1521 [Planctomycetota bacterium]|jgi:hypothetical protein